MEKNLVGKKVAQQAEMMVLLMAFLKVSLSARNWVADSVDLTGKRSVEPTGAIVEYAKDTLMVAQSVQM